MATNGARTLALRTISATRQRDPSERLQDGGRAQEPPPGLPVCGLLGEFVGIHLLTPKEPVGAGTGSL